MAEKKFHVFLGKYKGIQCEKPNIEPTEEEVAAFLQREQVRRALLTAVDRPAALGDTVVIDFAGYVGDRQFEGGTAEAYALVLGSGSFIPGFEDQLVGASAGDKVDVNVTFPERYHAADLAGKPAVFKCTVRSVQEKKLPALDDDFAAQYGMDTFEEMEQAARDNLKKQKANHALQDTQNKLVSEIIAGSTVEVEPEYVEDCITQLINAFQENLASRGVSLESYLQYTGVDMAALREQFRPQAESSAKATAVLLAVADAENIQVPEEAVEAEVRKMAESYDMDVEEVKKGMSPENWEGIRNGMRAAKALEFVVSASVVVED